MSDLRWLIEQIDAEMEAAQLGLSGLSQGSADHRVITAKTERAVERVAPLLQRVETLLMQERSGAKER